MSEPDTCRGVVRLYRVSHPVTSLWALMNVRLRERSSYWLVQLLAVLSLRWCHQPSNVRTSGRPPPSVETVGSLGRFLKQVNGSHIRALPRCAVANALVSSPTHSVDRHKILYGYIW